MKRKKLAVLTALVLSGTMSAASARDDACASLPTQSELRAALIAAVAEEASGLDFQMWATIVDRDGVVCAVAFSGANRGAQWPGSRVISAQKANAANAFSLDGLALSTANLYSATQPGGSLYGLQHSNPVATKVAYEGAAEQFGTPATRWWVAASAASTYSAAASRCTTRDARWSVHSASAAIRHAPIT